MTEKKRSFSKALHMSNTILTAIDPILFNEGLFFFRFFVPGRTSLPAAFEEVDAITLSPIDIIAGDFNCLANSGDPLDSFINGLADDNGLLDADPLDLPTFSNHNGERRLDRMYLARQLVCGTPNVMHHPRLRSDHALISTEIQVVPVSKPLPRFRLHPSTIENENIVQSINNYIYNYPTTSNVIQWSELKLEIINRLKIAQNTSQKSFFYKINNLKSQLNNISTTSQQKRIINNKIDEHFNNKIKHNNIKRELEKYGKEEIPSKVLTGILKKKHKEAHIASVYDSNGRVVTGEREKQDAFKDFYSSLFEATGDDAKAHVDLLKHWKVPDNINLSTLDDHLDVNELRDSLFTTHSHKAPGPDGLTGFFYKTFSSSLQPHLLAAFDSLITNPNQPMDKEFKSGSICTLYKKGDPLDINNYRPITLLNVDYKLFTKIINNRLSNQLHKIINNNQNGFVKGRFIIDSIITLNEIIEYNKKHNKQGVICLYDFHKAFDSISHPSISRTLEHLKVPKNTIDLIMGLLTGAEASVVVNGNLSSSFKLGRGTRQGDPLSPTLFVLVIEALARAIEANGHIDGLSMSSINKIIKFGQFADDTISFTPNYSHHNLILKILNNFCKATSSKINLKKCAIIELYKKDKIEIDDAARKCQDIPTTTTAERYLGIYFSRGGLSSRITETAQNITERLQKWKKECMTLRNKIVILNTYALSPLTYQFYINDMDDDSAKKINNVARWFLFSSFKNNYDSLKRYKTLMRDDRACRPWKEGGINLIDVQLRASAQKIWVFNRFWSKVFANEELVYSRDWVIQIRNNVYTSPYLENIKNKWLDFYKQLHLNNLIDKDFNINKVENQYIIKQMNYIKNEDGTAISLKEIYHKLLDIKHKRIGKSKEVIEREALTNGQKDTYGMIGNHIFPPIASLKHPKGRNTMFRFYARCLPGLIYKKGDTCVRCDKLYTDPYQHYFFECTAVSERSRSLCDTINILTGGNLKEWKLQEVDISVITNKLGRSKACGMVNAIAITFNEIWIEQANILYGDDEQKQLYLNNNNIHQQITEKYKRLGYILIRSSLKVKRNLWRKTAIVWNLSTDINEYISYLKINDN